MRAYELVYAALGARERRRRLDVGTTRRQGARRLGGRRGRRPRRGRVRALDARSRAGPSRTPRTGGGRPRRRSRDLGVDEVAGIGLSGQMHGLVALDADEQVLRPAILWNDQRTGAECEEIEERIGLERLIAATGNRALTGFTAPKLLWLREARARGARADRAHPAAEGLRAPAAVRRARDRRRRRVGHAAVRRRAPRVEQRGLRGARGAGGVAAARARVARGVGRDGGRHAGRRRRGRPGGGRARRRRRRGGRAAVGRARHLRRRVLRAAGVRRRPRGARARVLPRGAGDVARDGRDALRRGRAALAARRDRRRAPTTASSCEEAAALGARASRA